MEASEIRAQAGALLGVNGPLPDNDAVLRIAALVYSLAIEVEQLERERVDLTNRLAAVERRLGAVEELMP